MSPLGRRFLRASLTYLFACSSLLVAQSTPPPSTPAPAPILLWPNGAPGAVGDTPLDKPTVTPFLPAQNPTHTAIVICPGGGYSGLAIDYEGTEVAQWLNDRGVAAFVLTYRYGPRYHHPIPLLDAQRAIRYVRTHASRRLHRSRPHRHYGIFCRRSSRFHGWHAFRQWQSRRDGSHRARQQSSGLHGARLPCHQHGTRHHPQWLAASICWEKSRIPCS